jgi:hypothetical protein
MTISRTITVAGGVFAPGHLGELTQVLPFDLVDVVLEETATRERRWTGWAWSFPRPGRCGTYGGAWARRR